ncbi:uncharacterized protein LOC6543426 [Drosophila erecta]|uniref:Uncharacterized protein n=1 Tax=Drosophila erecta TaxID=7220 RepID=B3N925_DROER|nr:uncharacterized protein LOC6543426 [Drosophila erecta]EDV58460.2 uncharacterized protein Dere_GG23979 [Drosophila erecta]
MRTSLLIVGSLLVTIFLAHLPVGLAVSCATDATDPTCTDCTLPANADAPDCVTVAPVTAAPPADAESSTIAGGAAESTTAATAGTDTTTAASGSTGGTGKGGKRRVKRVYKRKVKHPKRIIKRRTNRRRNKSSKTSKFF